MRKWIAMVLALVMMLAVAGVAGAAGTAGMTQEELAALLAGTAGGYNSGATELEKMVYGAGGDAQQNGMTAQARAVLGKEAGEAFSRAKRAQGQVGSTARKVEPVVVAGPVVTPALVISAEFSFEAAHNYHWDVTLSITLAPQQRAYLYAMSTLDTAYEYRREVSAGTDMRTYAMRWNDYVPGIMLHFILMPEDNGLQLDPGDTADAIARSNDVELVYP